MRSVHVRSFGSLLDGRLPVALHVDEPARVGIGATLRVGTEVDEHPVDRLKVHKRRLGEGPVPCT